MKYDAIIIGAGLGGLSAGAFLSKAGRKVLVLEKTGSVGGRCRSIELMGHRYDVGADYFGSRMLRIFDALGKAREVRPIRFKVLSHADGRTMTIPAGLHTASDLKGMGMSSGEIASLGYRMLRQLAIRPYKITNINDLINFMTKTPRLRDIFNIGAFFSGNLPENMPAYWFRLVFGGT